MEKKTKTEIEEKTEEIEELDSVEEIEEVDSCEEFEDLEFLDEMDDIDPSEAEIARLYEEIGKLNEEIDNLKNEYARAYADTENTRKRLKAEAEQERKYRIQSFAKEVLPVIDNLERALSQEVTSEEAINFKKGIQMTYDQLVKALSEEGVEEIEVLDKAFDANEAQAIMVEKRDGVDSGIVIEVLQKGYRLKDRILRPAMVKVSE